MLYVSLCLCGQISISVCRCPVHTAPSSCLRFQTKATEVRNHVWVRVGVTVGIRDWGIHQMSERPHNSSVCERVCMLFSVCPHCIMEVPPFSVPCTPTLFVSLSFCLSFSLCTTMYLSLILSLFLYLSPSFFPSLSVSPSLRPCVYFYLQSIC